MEEIKQGYFNKAYQAHNKMVQYGPDNESPIADLQIQVYLTEIAATGGEGITVDEAKFIHSMAINPEALKEKIDGYRKFFRNPSLESLRQMNLPDDVRDKIYSVPPSIRQALKRGSSFDAEELLQCFYEIMSAFIAIEREGREAKRKKRDEILSQSLEESKTNGLTFVVSDAGEIELKGKEKVYGAFDENLLNRKLEELNQMVGLKNVKEQISSLISRLRIRKKQEEAGMQPDVIPLHMIFYGNPGTGKTTVAKLLADIYKSLGILSKDGKLIELSRNEMVGEWIGHTEKYMREIIHEAMGGVLFIDEAYRLVNDETSGNDFGKIAVESLLKAMGDKETKSNMVVIAAGYTQPMKEFLNSNPGFESRFRQYIDFPDYTPDELMEILLQYCKRQGFQMDESAEKVARNFFIQRYEKRDQNFGNARDVENYFGEVLNNQARRLDQPDVSEKINNSTPEEAKALLSTIIMDDVLPVTLTNVKGT